MSINLNVKYPGRVTAPSADYPYGSSKNETSPGAGDGTPYEIARADDIFGLQQSLLRLAGITPSGDADTALLSEYLHALVELSSGRATNYDDGGVADVYVASLRTNQQGVASYFDGLIVDLPIANDNTGASTIDVEGTDGTLLGVKDIKTATGANPVAGDITGRLKFRYDLTNDWFEILDLGADETRHIESGTCAQAAGGLTFTLNETILDFRSTALTDGLTTPTPINSPITLVLPSGGTLGFPTTVQGRVLVACMGNGELAICALGSLQNNEENLISTTAISAASTADNVWYSTVSRTNQPYRIVMIADVVNTAGAWANPVLVQGMGGNALTAMSSLGYGQTWQDLTGSRAVSTIYYNTTGKPIEIYIGLTMSVGATTVDLNVNGVAVQSQTSHTVTPASFAFSAIIPPNHNYSLPNVTGISNLQWGELR